MEGSETNRQHHFCNKAFAIRYRIAIGLLVICIFGLIADNWLTESFGSNPLAYTGRVDPTHDKGLNFHLSLLASGNGRTDLNATPLDDSVYADTDDCQVPNFYANYEPPPEVTCKRPKPRKDSCRVADEVFLSTPTPNCSHQETHIICKINDENSNRRVTCSRTLCKQTVSMGTISPSEGILKWIKEKNISRLENAIINLIVGTPKNPNFGFCYLTCSLHNGTTARQLLLLPQNFVKNEKAAHHKAINVNVIWLDSTSHSHFFRSMSQTVKQLERLRDEKEAHVFSYNLMQSLKGGTYVNTVAFTSGNIKQRKFLLDHHSPIGNLFKIFKDGGYHTMWMDDLCWTWSIRECACGIPKFLGMKSDKSDSSAWKKVKQALRTKGVEQIDISLSNCEIMNANNITDPFKDSVAICYNGFYQSHYIMSSLEMIQTELNNIKRPYFHYTDLNLGHESSGRRIQTLDESLAKYVQFLSTQDNTLTLMFGDHGNKYGTFVQKSRESKIEMAHPVLFIIASRNIAENLGSKQCHALEVNQDRMVNILDLRHTVLSLAPGTANHSVVNANKYDVDPKGLFIPINPNRTCKSMGIEPEAGKCICETGKIIPEATNSTGVLLLAEYAIGHINNVIQKQFRQAHSSSKTGFGACQRLVPTQVSNVFVIVDKENKTIEFDVHVPGGENAEQDEDIFALVFEIPLQATPNNSNLLTMIHYERITTYGVYDKCRDKGVAGPVCVCSLKRPIKKPNFNNIPKWHLHSLNVLGHLATIASSNDCIYVYERRTMAGLVLEASSDCYTWRFTVSVQVISSINIVSSKSLLSTVTLTLNPGMMMFLVAFVQCDPSEEWNLDYDIQFQQLPP